MTTTTSRRMMVCLALCAGSWAALLAVPPGAYASERGEAPLISDGWWYRDRDPLADAPPAPDPVGDLGKTEVRNRSNPYSGTFLRVGTNAGRNEALLAFGFDTFSLSDDPVVITGGTVTFVAAPAPSQPAATDGAAGQRNVEAADMVACLVTDFFAGDDAGNWADQPPTDCAAASSPLLPVDGAEQPTWTVDLAPFAPTWADPLANFGIAVLPNPEIAEPDPEATWHVAFDSPRNDREGATPPLAELSFEIQEFEDPFDPPPSDASGTPPADDESLPPPDDPGTPPADDGGFPPPDDGGGAPDDGSTGGGPSGGGSAGGFAPGGSFDPGPPGADSGGQSPPAPEIADSGGPEAEAVAVEEPEIADDSSGAATAAEAAPFAAPAESAGQLQPAGAQTNPALILLPFLGVGLAVVLGYSLTQDAELPSDRKGAVSKLMQRRRAGETFATTR